MKKVFKLFAFPASTHVFTLCDMNKLGSVYNLLVIHTCVITTIIIFVLTTCPKRTGGFQSVSSREEK